MNMFIDSVDAYCKEHVDGHKFDQEKKIPEAVLKGFSELGVMGITIPTEYGGSGLSPRSTIEW